MESARFDVICDGGPFDGKIESVPTGRQAWEVWRPVFIPGQAGFGKELMGSYIVDPDRICAKWAEDIGFSHGKIP